MLSPGLSDRWLWLMILVKRKTSIKKKKERDATNAIHGANNATVRLPVLNADPQAARVAVLSRTMRLFETGFRILLSRARLILFLTLQLP